MKCKHGVRDLQPSLSSDDVVNGLKHMADDHPCCRTFALAAASAVEELLATGSTYSAYREELLRLRDIVCSEDAEIIDRVLDAPNDKLTHGATP